MVAFVGKMFGLGKKGSIQVTVDKPHYISGEIISGSLHVNVLEPIQCKGNDRFWVSGMIEIVTYFYVN
jgi:hypothetical protein